MGQLLVRYFRRVLIAVLVVGLVGCGDDFSDLNSFVKEVKARPKGLIDPIPTYPPYQSFSYQAMSKRSPFDRQVEVKELVRLAANSNVKPDLNRSKEYLESVAMESLRMVGTIYKSDVLWALVSGGGGVHRVTIGNFLGRNHGRIVSVSEDQVSLIEIVPNGAGAWVERPRSLRL